MAIDALRNEGKRLLFGSDSKVSDDQRIEIVKAIEVLMTIRKEEANDNHSDV